jgi:sulfur carrier protein ThiS
MIMIIIPVVAGIVAFAAFAGISYTSSHPHANGSNSNVEKLHIHPHLDVLVNGNPVTLPANIGISQQLYKDRSLAQYGAMSGMAPLHTHDDSGTVHVESTVVRNYTLGEFLNIWGKDLGGGSKTVKVSVDGNPIPDYRNHILRDGEKISLQINDQAQS